MKPEFEYNAELGYGFPLSEEIAIEVRHQRIKTDPNVFGSIWAGDAFNGDTVQYIVIKNSISGTIFPSASVLIPNEKLIVSPEWNQLLKDWAEENKIESPQIGWWLLALVI